MSREYCLKSDQYADFFTTTEAELQDVFKEFADFHDYLKRFPDETHVKNIIKICKIGRMAEGTVTSVRRPRLETISEITEL